MEPNGSKWGQTGPIGTEGANKGKTFFWMVTILGIVTFLEMGTVLWIVDSYHTRKGDHPRDCGQPKNFYHPMGWILF